MFTPCCYSFYSKNDSSLARGRGLDLNMRDTNIYQGCFSFTNNHDEFQILTTKLVLCGKEKQVRNQNPNPPLVFRTARGRNHCMHVLSENKGGIFLPAPLLYTNFIYYSCTFHIHNYYLLLQFFTVPTISLPGSVTSVFCILNFWLFVSCLPAAVVCTLQVPNLSLKSFYKASCQLVYVIKRCFQSF